MDPPHPLMEGHVETGKAILHLTALFSFYRFPISMREYNVECNCHWCLQPLFKKNLQALAQENEITQKLACL
ncbi:hypothetical protein NC652_031617 [Populus alba x Populus x berolinensis]|nr:hypothetical protein NC652_031617 [Populus alba x Populus x berolinensis]